MGSKRFRIRTGARTTSKSQERELISKARQLAKNPEVVVPRCAGKCFLCPFEKSRRQIARIAQLADDPAALGRASEGGDLLARAYAATLSLAHADKVPFLAVLRTPMGEIPYAYRGKTKKEKLAGVQNFDNPRWRLMAVVDEVQKHKVHVYSTETEMVCTGKAPRPPEEYVKEVVGGLKTRLRRAEGVHFCEHLNAEGVKARRAFSEPYMVVAWRSAGLNIAICRRCLASGRDHTLGKLTERIASLNALADFDVQFVTRPECAGKGGCSPCPVKESPPVDSELFARYAKGEIMDDKFATEHLDNVRRAYQGLSQRVFIGGSRCCGPNIKQFLRDMNPSEDERAAMIGVLKAVPETVYVDRMSANRLLSTYWKDYGKRALFAATGDRELAIAVYKEFDVSKTPPGQIIKEAVSRLKQKSITSALPEYGELPAPAKFADGIARTFMTRGAEEAVRAVDRYREGDTLVKGVAFAFLLALERAASKRWQYTKTEQDAGEFLLSPVKELLAAQPENYHARLQAVLAATGSTVEIRPA